MVRNVCVRTQAYRAENNRKASKTIRSAIKHSPTELVGKIARSILKKWQLGKLLRLLNISGLRWIAFLFDRNFNHMCTVGSQCKPITAPVHVQIQWASGDVACNCLVHATTTVLDLKALVQDEVGVAIDEQSLYADGLELRNEANVPHAEVLRLVLVDPRVSNLAHFRSASKFLQVPQEGFTEVHKLQKGINGDIFKYRWGSQDVAVKRLDCCACSHMVEAQTDERQMHLRPRCTAPSSEDALTEIGVFNFLAQQEDTSAYLLKMLAVFSDDHSVWLVTEFAEGGELFDVAKGGISQTQAKDYMSQLLQATSYLHQHRIAHRDLSLENVLLKGGSLRLMDFGAAVLSHSSSGRQLRYFRMVGKPFYQAPECYVARVPETRIVAPIGSKPGDIVMLQVESAYLCEVRLPKNATPGQECTADLWGYAACPADVFSLGICMFILLYQCPPWACARLHNRGFEHAYKHGDDGLAALLKCYGKQLLAPVAMELMSNMLRPDPYRRKSAAECLKSSWLEAWTDAAIATHEQVAAQPPGVLAAGGA